MSQQEMKELVGEKIISFARYVIQSRAIPNVGDGMKIIHRRVVYAMNEKGLKYNKYRTKSVDAVGGVLRYSPHGDSSAYGAMVRLANDSVVYNQVDGKGNWGTTTSRDVDASSPRYTEARLSHLSEYLCRNLNKNAVDFIPTYDDRRLEPAMLPAMFPLILANSNTGIAMGISTNIPSFDLKDIRENTYNVLYGKEMIPMYPNFATGGMVLREEDVSKTVENTGRGAFRLRGRYYIESDTRIIITELPYGSQIEPIIKQLITLANDKNSIFSNITEVNDDSDKDGFKLRIDVKKNTDKDLLMKMAYAKTGLENKFSCNMYVLDNNNIPRLWGTRQILLEWIRFRADVIVRVAKFDLAEAEKELNVYLGLEKVMDELDEVIALIRKSTEDDVIETLVGKGYNEEQAKYIVALSLRSLTTTSINKKIKNRKALETKISDLKGLIGDKKAVAKEIIRGIDEVIENEYIERKTEIVDEFETVNMKAVKAVTQNDYNVRLIVTNDGYVKKIPLTSLRSNPHIQFKDGDFAVQDIDTVNSEEVLIFTNQHNVYKKRLEELKDTKPSELGTFILNEINIQDGEEIVGIVGLSEDIKHILIGFDNGKVAKIEVEAYRTKQNRSVLKNGYANAKAKLIVGLSEDVDLLSLSTDTKTIVMNTESINPKGSKTTQGTTFQKLKDGNIVEQYEITDIDSEPNIEYYRVQSAGVGKFYKK